MKITVNIELAHSELNRAPQIQAALAELSPSAVVRFKTDTTALSDRIKKAIQTKQYDAVVNELVERLSYPVTFDASLEVMCTVALFSKGRADSGESVAPFIDVVPRLPEEAQSRAKEAIVQRAVAFLSKPRRLDCSRISLLVYAEAIAVMVKKELLSIRNVIGTVVQMIESETSRTAGMTCLGKLVEIAYEATRNCDPVSLSALRAAVRYAQSNDIFLYDVEYIMEAFGWSSCKPALSLRRSTSHHENPILTLAYCGGANCREVVVTSSSDGTIGTWDGVGVLLQNVLLSRHYASCVDLTNRGHTLIVGAVGRYSNTPPAVIFYNEDGNRKAQWQECGGTEPDDASFLSCLKCLKDPSGSRYCVGVRTSSANPLLLYDGSRVTQRYFDHSDIITAIHVPSDRDNVVVTGSRDCSTLLYDLRDPRNVSSMAHHNNTVSCITSCDNYLFTAGLDKRLVVADLRMLRGSTANRDMDSAVLSVSVNSSLQCAVSTLTGVYVINFANGTNVPTSSHADCGGSSLRFNTVCWNNAGNILYGGGEGRTLDLFAPTYDGNVFEA
ncbi:guanine nucleotide-binding protein, beta subunit-like protein [Leptomonas pyrrhocoris]|uniref:Guanine nucleotide-binding protein, beta subunit-like protein n=1 Tax=Leptomonas pyrrhocoris TaxID=157538 RepID=A0A0M9FZ08_LEPPY|nr:guanine nucleotide-binding protein, beta subunit-like protein [Leptomonas pyrrhocoris]XP_015657444.1 guanine nucleotide-binding protein, beta subunit-like protein [Leptomonas pyrrhocoris]KPA79004.1 guanine nucleotide-binding protein, beta subunit-like protein [Leptomonas pyrrhocoris]KPA79005.1 guanine nucleotide-binding protein, beta subunit-like protein [Leptomonas pyrrhocoris]|eukprot:XP_015657443.1 guanine nucleotide-binding protein, beta subunit-like protein [Leptomonas pyrrhocoris]